MKIFILDKFGYVGNVAKLRRLNCDSFCYGFIAGYLVGYIDKKFN
jgi:hypothetical protein